MNFQQRLREEEEESYRSKRSSNLHGDYPKVGSGGSSSIESFMDSREHEHGEVQEDLPLPATKAPPRVNEGKQQYDLRCQHAKKVFTDAEMAQFRLQRRKNTADTQFDVDLILGKRPSPYAAKPIDDAEAQRDELNAEMQRILARAITKVLEQKSIRETAHNMNQLVVEAIEGQLHEQTRQGEKETKATGAVTGSHRPGPGTARSRKGVQDRGQALHQQREREELVRRDSKRKLAIQASKKLIETLQHQEQ